MAHLPANARLWAMYVAQAKQRFQHYPSPAAAHWVHDKYVKAGGHFVATDHADRETVRISEEKYRKLSKQKREADHKKGK